MESDSVSLLLEGSFPLALLQALLRACSKGSIFTLEFELLSASELWLANIFLKSFLATLLATLGSPHSTDCPNTRYDFEPTFTICIVDVQGGDSFYISDVVSASRSGVGLR